MLEPGTESKSDSQLTCQKYAKRKVPNMAMPNSVLSFFRLYASVSSLMVVAEAVSLSSETVSSGLFSGVISSA